MANPDRPRGFDPLGKVRRVGEYVAGSDIKPGDMLKLAADGKVDPVDTGGAIYATACMGVALSVASDGEAVSVSDHPDQEYLVQADGADVDDQTDINLNYAIVATDASTTFALSRMELDSSSGLGTNTLPLKLIRIDKGEKNELGANVDCVVRINNNQLVADAGSTGV